LLHSSYKYWYWVALKASADEPVLGETRPGVIVFLSHPVSVQSPMRTGGHTQLACITVVFGVEPALL
jgi:hypothetical protein